MLLFCEIEEKMSAIPGEWRGERADRESQQPTTIINRPSPHSPFSHQFQGPLVVHFANVIRQRINSPMISAMCLDNEETMAADEEALFKEQKSNCNCFSYHRPSAGLYKKVLALSWVGVSPKHTFRSAHCARAQLARRNRPT